MASNVYHREVVSNDLPIFYEQQNNPEAIHMAALTAKDPTDQETFHAHWQRILTADTVIIRTIMYKEQVAGYVLSYEDDGKPEVSYWPGKTFWERGIATEALATFLADANQARPIYGRAAKDNIGSIRVMEKCGFTVIGETIGFARARDEEIEEIILVKTAKPIMN
jgi:RimJ/RimL family protein N-acetyltransferase